MAAQHAMGRTTAAARLAITASWAVNHPALRSTEVVPDMAVPTWAIIHTAPDATQPAASEKMVPIPSAATPPAMFPAAPDNVLQTAPATGSDPGHRGNASSTSQCTPCPAWKKKLTMAGAAPINSAANAETRTVFFPLKDWW